MWWGNDAEGRALARACNESTAEMVRAYPGRYGFFASIPLPDVDDPLTQAHISRHKWTVEMCPTDDAVGKPSLFLQTLHGCANCRSRNLAPLGENLAHLKHRRLPLFPHDFHDFPLPLGKRRQFWI